MSKDITKNNNPDPLITVSLRPEVWLMPGILSKVERIHTTPKYSADPTKIVTNEESAALRSSGFLAEIMSLLAAVITAINTRKYPTYFNISRKKPPSPFGKKSDSIFSWIDLSLLTTLISKTFSVPFQSSVFHSIRGFAKCCSKLGGVILASV